MKERGRRWLDVQCVIWERSVWGQCCRVREHNKSNANVCDDNNNTI